MNQHPKQGETNLSKLIANMQPVLHAGEYIFATLPHTAIDRIPRHLTLCEVKEKEGVTIVVSKQDAETLGLPIKFVMTWITLNVHSALESVGLTAAFASELAKHNISCNVVAGYYHDHIFVDTKDQNKAIQVLKAMSNKSL